MVPTIAALSLLIWLYLLLARGGFWRVASDSAGAPPALKLTRRVVAIIPARDEAAVIGKAVSSLLQQSYGGLLHVIVVDDGSTDGTASAALEAAERIGAAARLTVVAGAPLRRVGPESFGRCRRAWPLRSRSILTSCYLPMRTFTTRRPTSRVWSPMPKLTAAIWCPTWWNCA